MRLIRIILILILVIFDAAAAYYFVLMPLSAISLIGTLFCDHPHATIDQCVGKAMSVFLPIALVAYAPFITVFVFANVIIVRFLVDTFD